MRDVADEDRIRGFMAALGRHARQPARVYLTGGATAVLHGWRASTVDVDIRIVPEEEAVFRAIPQLKKALNVNVELASPADFIPVREGWEDRSPFIERHGRLAFHHFELDAQALAKISRGHAQDREDVEAMLERSLLTRDGLAAYFDRIEPELYRFPALDPASFRAAVEAVICG